MTTTPQPNPNLRVFTCLEKLRNGDTDQQGHINNAAIATLFEAGRVEVLGHEGMGELAKAVTIVVARLEIDFKRELFFPGVAEIQSQITRIGNTSFCFAHTLVNEGTVAASGLATCVLLDKATRKPRPVPPAMRVFLTEPV